MHHLTQGFFSVAWLLGFMLGGAIIYSVWPALRGAVQCCRWFIAMPAARASSVALLLVIVLAAVGAFLPHPWCWACWATAIASYKVIQLTLRYGGR